MKEYFALYGNYNLRSRISPGIILISPVLLTLYLLVPSTREISFTVVIAGICLSFCNLMLTINRHTASKAKEECFPGLLPAQELLLSSNKELDSLTKERYLSFLHEHVGGFEAITTIEEEEKYACTAISWLISKTRDSSDYPLIYEENINFGFATTLLGLKKAGIIISTVCLLSSAIVSYIVVTNNELISSITKIEAIVSLLLNCLIGAIWVFFVNKKYVYMCGKKYAYALLSACDSLNE